MTAADYMAFSRLNSMKIWYNHPPINEATTMSTSITTMPDPVIFTDQAAAKVWELIQEEGNFSLKLRVYVTGGGCSGLQYGFTFVEETQADDTVVTKLVKKMREKKEADEEETDEEGGDEEGADEEEGDGDGDGSGTSVQLLIDALSFQYLAGAEIDYKEDIEGEQFIIRNPNAKTTCGCGSSFTTE